MAYVKELMAYQKGFALAMKIFELSKSFPMDEKYSLTDQIRRSSRSVCTNLAEAYRKRLYNNHFVAKVSDADMENAETQTWLHFALECKYISKVSYDELLEESFEVGRLLGFMIKNPSRFK